MSISENKPQHRTPNLPITHHAHSIIAISFESLSKPDHIEMIAVKINYPPPITSAERPTRSLIIHRAT